MRTKLGRKLMSQALDTFARQEIKPTFEGFVSDWETEVKFRIVKKVGYKEIRVEVVPHKGKKIFTYVDKGTKGPYPITPKKRRPKSKGKKALAFQLGYSARTAPIAQAHLGSGTSSGEWMFAQKVMHPGIKARQFSETVRKDTLPEFRKITEAVFRKLQRSMKS